MAPKAKPGAKDKNAQKKNAEDKKARAAELRAANRHRENELQRLRIRPVRHATTHERCGPLET